MDEPEGGGGTRGGHSPPDRSATERERQLEEIVAEFILRREEGEDPAIEEYLARHPRHAEDLAFLLADELGPPPPAPGGSGGSDSGATAPVRPGGPLRRVGPYEVLDQVAQGGGGTVYRARHAEEHHVVALKVLDRFGIADARDVERFQREARMLRGMDLVSVVPVHDVGEDDGRLWIAMKWIEGSTLAGLREAVKAPGHPLHDLRERARLLARVARTFGAIHGYGILHRDVKPSNVMVDRLGEPAIIDFGIAQAPDSSELTRTLDGPMGTPRYIAPELLSGGNPRVSAQADVYGLGLCLYELCTGVQAFFQKNRGELFSAIQGAGPPDPRILNAAIPFELAAVVLRAIEIDPRRRYASMNAFAADLEAWAKGEALPDPVTLRRAHPLRRFLMRHRRKLPAAAAAFVILAAGAWAALGAVERQRAESDRRRRIDEFAARIEPYAFAPPEVLPLDHEDLNQVCLDLRDLAPDRPDLHLRCAWIFFMGGEFENAIRMLKTPQPGEPAAAALLRDYLQLLTLRPDAQARPVSGAVSTLPGMENPEGKGEGDRFGTEVVAPRELTPAEAARWRRWSPPDPQAVDVLLERHPVPGSAPDLHLVRGLILWLFLPSDLGRDDPKPEVARVRAEIDAALDGDPGLVWARWIRAQLELRYGDVAAARPDLAAVAEAVPGRPAVQHALALSHALPWSAEGDPELASAAFAAAAGGHERALAVDAALPGDRFAAEPLRKLYAQWARHEALRGRPERVAEVLARWESAFRDPLWQDQMIPLLIRARCECAAGRAEEARRLLKAAREVNPKAALPLNEEYLLLVKPLGDADIEDRILLRASQAPMQLPRTLDQWLRGSFFGLRPYSRKLHFSSSIEPLRDGLPIDDGR